MNVQICQITLYDSGSTVGIYRNGIAAASFFYYRSVPLFDGDVCAAFTAVVIRSVLAVRHFFAIWRAISVIVFILTVLIFV